MSETKNRLTFTLVLLVSLALVAFSTSGPKAEQDTQLAVERVISAAESGGLGVMTADGADISVIFPEQSLEKDTTIVLKPLTTAPLNDKELVVKGFQIEEKGKAGQGPKLSSPAVIRISLKTPITGDVSIIKYADDGKNYDVIPTTIEVEGQTTIFTAEVDAFSKYGIRSVTKKQIQDAADKLGKRNFTWAVEFKDGQEMKAPDGTQVTMTLDMTAVNKSGSMSGQYTGAATLISTGVKKVDAIIPAVAQATLKAGQVKFKASWTTQLTPPVKPKPNSPPPLVPLLKADLRAKGTMKFALSIASLFNPETEVETVDVPFELFTSGSRAVISFQIPGTQELKFARGTFTRKGKK